MKGWILFPTLPVCLLLVMFLVVYSAAQDFKEPDIKKAEKECGRNGAPGPEPVPFKDENGDPNLALLKDAKPNASSLLGGWCPQRHCTEYLNDGFYNNCRSWIPATNAPCWAEIDLGDIYTVHKVAFGSEHVAHYKDRTVTEFNILVAVEYAEDSKSNKWKKVFHLKEDKGIRDTTSFEFKPVQARWVRIDILANVQGQPRIDEIEIYGTLAVEPGGKLTTTWGKIKNVH